MIVWPLINSTFFQIPIFTSRWDYSAGHLRAQTLSEVNSGNWITRSNSSLYQLVFVPHYQTLLLGRRGDPERGILIRNGLV